MNKIKSTIKIILPLSIVAALLVLFCPVVVADNLGDFNKNLQDAAGPDGAGYISASADDIAESIFGEIISIALSFVGVIFLALMIYGGYMWMTAAGNEQHVDKAKNLIKAAIIGLIIVLSAYAVTYYVVQTVGNKTLR